jgi:hypothetical protein
MLRLIYILMDLAVDSPSLRLQKTHYFSGLSANVAKIFFFAELDMTPHVSQF